MVFPLSQRRGVLVAVEHMYRYVGVGSASSLANEIAISVTPFDCRSPRLNKTLKNGVGSTHHVDSDNSQVVKVGVLVVERCGGGEQRGGGVDAEQARAALQRVPHRGRAARLHARQHAAGGLVLVHFAHYVRGEEPNEKQLTIKIL